MKNSGMENQKYFEWGVRIGAGVVKLVGFLGYSEKVRQNPHPGTSQKSSRLDLGLQSKFWG